MDDVLQWEGEQLVICRDRATGMRAVIAIDDTTLGPGLGGVRYRPYADVAAAAREAQRLAAAMTRKNAVARLPYGGAKAVILDDGLLAGRADVMRAFGACVARLGGAYVPGVDMGTTVGDLATMATVAPGVACDDEDPSPWTALGVAAGIRAAVTGDADGRLDGVTVAIQGVGQVGEALAGLLGGVGARVVVADVDAARARAVAHTLGGRAVAADAILDEPCDVFAPCAAAKVVDAAAAERLRCRWIAGAANDTLAAPDVLDALTARSIAYVPDYVVNAGGVIHIHGLREGWTRERLTAEVLGIGDRVRAIMDEARTTGASTVDVAQRLADAALGRGVARALSAR